MPKKRMIAIMMLLLLFCGCLSAFDVADCAYVQSLGIERGDTFAYRVALLTALPQSDGESGATPKMTVLCAEARTVFEAIETLNAGLSLQLNFSRTSLLLIGEGIAKSGGMNDALDFSLGTLDIFPNVRIMVAADALDRVYAGLISDADPSFSKTMRNLTELARHSGTVRDVRYRTYREAQSVGASDLLIPLCGTETDTKPSDPVQKEAYPYFGDALLTSGANGTSIMGSAVFDGDRMAGRLSGRHTQLCGMADGSFQRGRMQWYHPEYGMLSMHLERKKPPKIHFDPKGTSVTISLTAVPETPRLLSDPDGEIERWLERSIERELAETLDALQKMNADGMGFGRYDLMHRPFEAEWTQAAWKETYRTLAVVFEVELHLEEHKEGTL